MKKINIFECYRTLLYAPLYHIYLLQDKYDLKDIEIEFVSSGKGDIGAMNDMVNYHDEDAIPILIADPTTILNGTQDENDLKIITTLIDRLAIWLIAAEYNIRNIPYANKQKCRTHNEKLKLLIDKKHDLKIQLSYISKGFEIAYPKKAETTKKIIKKYFSKIPHEKIHEIEELSDLPKNELKHLLEGRLVLTNSIWNCYESIKGSEHEGKLLIKSVCDFGSLPISFTGLITSKKHITRYEKTEDLTLQKFIYALGMAIEKLYYDPISFAEDLYQNKAKLKSNGKIEEFNFNIDLESEDFIPILNRNIQKFADSRVYNLSMASNFVAWSNYLKDLKGFSDEEVINKYDELTRNIITNEFMISYLKQIKP